MESSLPFRHENEKTLLDSIHPLIRLILPFIFVIPFLIITDIYLTITLIIISLICSLISRLNLFRVLKRIKSIFPFVILITIFVPFYVGTTIMYQINIGFLITIYQEGASLAIILFLRIFGAIFIFMSFFSSLTYSEFIEALTKLKVIPAMFIGSLVIMLHYIPILASSNKKILEAQELRGKKITTYREKLKSHAYIMGKSIIMNMERSEKLYESLKMRGFSGNITFAPRKLHLFDLLILAVFISIIITFIFIINLESIYIGVISLFLQ